MLPAAPARGGPGVNVTYLMFHLSLTMGLDNNISFPQTQHFCLFSGYKE